MRIFFCLKCYDRFWQRFQIATERIEYNQNILIDIYFKIILAIEKKIVNEIFLIDFFFLFKNRLIKIQFQPDVCDRLLD